MFYLLLPSRDPALEIVILDIFGFEEFQRNGFEQVGTANLSNLSLSEKYTSMFRSSFVFS